MNSTSKKLSLSKETVKNLTIRTAVKAGYVAPTMLCSYQHNCKPGPTNPK